ncbi:MAG: DUF362 domain-containing protein [Planctomycetota bacterium]
MLSPPGTYRAQVYHVTDCPPNPTGAHFVGLDNLILLMGSEGLKLYDSAEESPVAGPGGIVAADDVVVIKINYQWSERGGTNVDLLRGLVQRIVEHPDGFAGEIVICENAQFASVNGFNRSNNNAQNIGLSPHDVVVEFQGLGWSISHYDWTAIRNISVGEYSAGNMSSGYVLYPYDSQLQGRVSYPKFQSAAGTYISLRHGIWDTTAGAYDREHLKFINVPVLKSHHATYGITACVKNYMGTVTGALGTNSHNSIHYGILGALLGEIQLADLNLLDCIWVNANPYSGPWTDYGEATRRDELVASVDPVAADIWSAVNILIPAFIANGHSPPWPYPSADPGNPGSAFRQYLDNSMSRILSAGYEVTNDPAQIDLFTWDGVIQTDCNSNGIPDEWELGANDCNTNGVPDDSDIASGTSEDTNGDGIPDECCMPFVRGEVNGDGEIDIGDAVYLLAFLFGPGPAPLPVPDAGDANNDDTLDVADAIYIIWYLFNNGPAPPAPFPDPGCE